MDPTDHDEHAGHDHGNCDEALHELYTFLDGELTDDRRTRIRTHLDDCSPCLEVFDFEAELERFIVRGERTAFGPSTQAIVEEAISRDIPYLRLNTASLVQLDQ